MKKSSNWMIAAFLALSAKAALAAGPVNINTADAQAIADGLTGVGISRAQAIVAYRDAHGPFKSVEELLAVKGIGEKLLEKNHGLVSVDLARE